MTTSATIYVTIAKILIMRFPMICRIRKQRLQNKKPELPFIIPYNAKLKSMLVRIPNINTGIVAIWM